MLDKWILSKLYGNIGKLREGYEKYNTPEIVRLVKNFVVDDLSNWYIRRVRDRARRGDRAVFETLWMVLVNFSKAIAPLTPFISETIFKNLTKAESVHLQDWPQMNSALLDSKLESEMQTKVRRLAEIAHSLRKEVKLPVRQVLAQFFTQEAGPTISDLEDVLKEEINVLAITWQSKSDSLDVVLTPKLIAMGEARKLIRQIQDERKKLKTDLDEYVNVVLPDWPKDFENEIKTRSLAKALTKGEFSVTRLP